MMMMMMMIIMIIMKKKLSKENADLKKINKYMAQNKSKGREKYY